MGKHETYSRKCGTSLSLQEEAVRVENGKLDWNQAVTSMIAMPRRSCRIQEVAEEKLLDVCHQPHLALPFCDVDLSHRND